MTAWLVLIRPANERCTIAEAAVEKRDLATSLTYSINAPYSLSPIKETEEPECTTVNWESQLYFSNVQDVTTSLLVDVTIKRVGADAVNSRSSWM